MLQTEFEERVGKRVTPDEYAIIESIYMAAEEVDKDRFCEEWKEKKLDDCQIVASLTGYANRMEVEKQQWRHTAEQEQEVARRYKEDLDDLTKACKCLEGERDALKAGITVRGSRCY